MRKMRIEPERVARGLAGGNAAQRTAKRVVVSLDDKTFAVIRERALKAGSGFAEQVRKLVARGLEADKE